LALDDEPWAQGAQIDEPFPSSGGSPVLRRGAVIGYEETGRSPILPHPL
jgi:hypothetical protein